jgi:hypothetical protein
VTCLRYSSLQSPFRGIQVTANDSMFLATHMPVDFRETDDLDEMTRDLILWFVSKNRSTRTTLKEIKRHSYFSGV